MRSYASFGRWVLLVKRFGPILGRCDGSLFIVKFSFVKYKIGEIFNDILMYVFHENFDASLWNVGWTRGMLIYDNSLSFSLSMSNLCMFFCHQSVDTFTTLSKAWKYSSYAMWQPTKPGCTNLTNNVMIWKAGWEHQKKLTSIAWLLFGWFGKSDSASAIRHRDSSSYYKCSQAIIYRAGYIGVRYELGQVFILVTRKPREGINVHCLLRLSQSAEQKISGSHMWKRDELFAKP